MADPVALPVSFDRRAARLRLPTYTLAMGAVETMETFFELLNAGDREGAVALMAESTEMRVHVGDSVQTLRGVERVGGWFLRGEKGLRMIPGGVRDTGNTYEADIMVVRPGAPSQHLDATFRVESGKITSINFAPR
jgi:ketosteroid isomerase-like protein